MKALVLVVMLAVAGCAAVATAPFYKGQAEQRNRALLQEIRRQSLGLKKHETDCYKIYSALADECGYDMSMACKRIRKARDRVGKIRRCDTTWNPEQIRGIMRQLDRGH